MRRLPHPIHTYTGQKQQHQDCRVGNDEAQGNRGGIDAHFAFLNKQQLKACLEGEIKLLDLHSMFPCRKYKGGVRAATPIILLKELKEAQDIHDLCKGSLQAKDTKGVNSVHRI